MGSTKVEHTLYDRSHRTGVVLSARRGIFCPDRSLRARPSKTGQTDTRSSFPFRRRNGSEGDSAMVRDADRTVGVAARTEVRPAPRPIATAAARFLRRRADHQIDLPARFGLIERHIDDASRPVRRQSVFRRQPHVRGKGPSCRQCASRTSRRDRGSSICLRRGHYDLSCARPMSVSPKYAITSAPTPSATEFRILSLHALRPQIRQRRHRTWDVGSDESFLPKESPVGALLGAAYVDGAQGH